MQVAATSFYDWRQRYATDAACLAALAALRWPNGFQCPHCGHDHGWFHGPRQLYECARCHRQTSITAGTLLHGSRVAPTKWFWTLYFMATDKGGISALRLAKLIGVQWRTAYAMLRKLRCAVGHRDRLYPLAGLMEIDDFYVGANKTGRAGRGGGRTPVLAAVEKREARPRFLALEVLPSLAKEHIAAFARRRVTRASTAHTDAFSSLAALGVRMRHLPKVTSPEEVAQWLPWVHIIIANLKRFLLGTFHGAVRPHRLQEYLDEFVYRFNRRFWEPQLPNRLLCLCVEHLPVDLRGTGD